MSIADVYACCVSSRDHPSPGLEHQQLWISPDACCWHGVWKPATGELCCCDTGPAQVGPELWLPITRSWDDATTLVKVAARAGNVESPQHCGCFHPRQAPINVPAWHDRPIGKGGSTGLIVKGVQLGCHREPRTAHCQEGKPHKTQPAPLPKSAQGQQGHMWLCPMS